VVNSKSVDDQIRLKVGEFTCFLDGADIRELWIGGRRILSRLYIAVRDEAWNTVPYSCSEPEISMGLDGFDVRLRCAVDVPPIGAEWIVRIAATSEGEFEYAMDGRMSNSFRFAKLGLNLHHPLPESLGARYVARCGDETVTGRISSLIEPQFYVDEKLSGMFMPYEELDLEVSHSEKIAFHFSGDKFEMQDHRNWTDYNLKSYGTPQSVPVPLSAEPGQRIFQSVRIHCDAARSTLSHVPLATDVAIKVDRSRIVVLPCLGSEFPDEIATLDEQVADLIQGLELGFVRVNLDLTSEKAAEAGTASVEQVTALGCRVELALVLSPEEVRASEVARLQVWLERVRPHLERVVVLEGPRGYRIGRTATPGQKVRALRDVIESQCGPVAMVAGTEQHFAELNRAWPDLDGVDGVGYTICPQVHAADDASIMENSWGQADTVLTARARTGRRPVHIFSLALIGKFGPYPGGIPDVPVRTAYGDPRQYTTFAAAWTVSSLRQLIDAEAASATYFELAGDRGLVRPTTGPDSAGATGTDYVPGPVYRVLEVVTHWNGGNLVRVSRVEGSMIIGVGMEWSDRSEYLLANLEPVPRRVELSNLSGMLDEVSDIDPRDSSAPAEWVARARESVVQVSGQDSADFEIGPYGVVRLRSIL
jgi:hypothetical protein